MSSRSSKASKMSMLGWWMVPAVQRAMLGCAPQWLPARLTSQQGNTPANQLSTPKVCVVAALGQYNLGFSGSGFNPCTLNTQNPEEPEHFLMYPVRLDRGCTASGVGAYRRWCGPWTQCCARCASRLRLRAHPALQPAHPSLHSQICSFKETIHMTAPVSWPILELPFQRCVSSPRL